MDLQASFSLLWMLLLLPLAFVLAWYFYRENAWLSTQSKLIQRTLPILRGLGLFLLMLLLLNITLLFNKTEVERPSLITLIDNSSSMMRFRDSGRIVRELENFKKGVQERFSGKYDLLFYSVGSDIQEGGKISLNEDQSNHELGFKHLSEQYLNRNVGAVLFASDGNFNTGDNPSYAAEQLSLTPIITLGVGDTTPKRDQLIGNLFYNDVVFLKDLFPIEVDVEAFKIKNTRANIRLIHNGVTLATKTVDYSAEEQAFKQVQFQVAAEKTGFQAYTVSIDYLDGEYSRTNNSKTCYIEVIDSRNSLCFVTSSPHPDLSALRSAAETNENYLTTFSTPKELVSGNVKPDLVVWHGPNLPADQPAFEFLRSNKIPVLFVIPGNITNASITALDLFNLANQRGQTDEIQSAFNPGFTSFTLDETTRNSLELYPPLVSKFGSLVPKGNYETLLFQKVGKTVKKEPLCYFNKSATLSHGLIFGEGIWRWRLANYMKNKNHEHFNEIFLKIFAYLLVKREGIGLTVKFEKRFSKNDRISVNANFYNASLEAITTPKISLSLRAKDGKKYVHQFRVLNQGYSLDLGILAPGKYHWIATATHENKTYKKEGDFLVEDISLEKSVNAANHGVLKQLSKQSGGNYYPFSAYKKALDSIEKRSDITSIERINTQFWDMVDSWLYLLLIAFCFFTEWFLKRYFGAY